MLKNIHFIVLDQLIDSFSEVNWDTVDMLDMLDEKGETLRKEYRNITKRNE